MKKLSFTLLALGFFAVRCSGDLPLSDLINNTITLKVLGTYESNDGYNFGTDPKFGTLYKDDIITGTQISNASPTLTGAGLDIVDYANNQLTISRLKYYIDIAEIRIAEGQGKSSSQSISDYWSQLAISRQLMCTDYTTADENRTLSNCSDSNGIQRLYDFFNGGFTYPAVDVANGNYNHMGIYFRRFATAPAAIFTGEGKYWDGTVTGSTANVGNMASAEKVPVTVFDNRSIYARDVETLLQNKYGETAAEPLMFPLQRKDLSLGISNGAEPYVMEVRIFLRNLMMVHVKQLSGNSTVPAEATNSSVVYVAPSDWNIDHSFKDSTNADRQGGAVIMTARVYQPSKVGSIKMSTAGTAGHYFVAHPSDKVFDATTTLPLIATAAANSTLISNVAPGSYNVYRTCDTKICSNSSSAGTCDNVAGTDGFPETAKLCGTVTVTANTQSGVTTCACP